jgi:hypothetical protein
MGCSHEAPEIQIEGVEEFHYTSRPVDDPSPMDQLQASPTQLSPVDPSADADDLEPVPVHKYPGD